MPSLVVGKLILDGNEWVERDDPATTRAVMEPLRAVGSTPVLQICCDSRARLRHRERSPRGRDGHLHRARRVCAIVRAVQLAGSGTLDDP